MKTLLASVAAVLWTITAAGQGRISNSPVSITNGLTGTLADSAIITGLYFGPIVSQ